MKYAKQFATGALCRLKVLFWSVVMLGPLGARAQDVHFTRFDLSPLLQSPAQAGISGDLRAVLQYRDQWRSVGAPFTTASFAFDARINKSRPKYGYLAAGLGFFSDKAGDAGLRSLQGGLSLAYHLRTGAKSTVGAGMYVGWGQRTIDPSQLQWGEQYDGNAFNSALPTGESFGAASFSFVDVGLGGAWHYGGGNRQADVVGKKQVTVGLGCFHLTRPSYSFLGAEERLRVKFVLHGNARLPMGTGDFSLIPAVQYTRQGVLSELMVGTSVRFGFGAVSAVIEERSSAVSLGVFLRAKDAVAIAALFERGRFTFGVSYDVNTSDLRNASNSAGGLECTLSFLKLSPRKGT